MAKEITLSKEAIEFIDRICEHEVVIDNGIFITDEVRIAEDDHIAEIASFIASKVLDNTYMEINLDQDKEMLETVGRTLGSHFHIIQMLNWEVEQRRRQMLNLEKRIFALEEKQPKKAYKPKYK
jgi:hypothetical protein